MARHKDSQWNLPEGRPGRDGSSTHDWESIHTALLMDIRDELKIIAKNTATLPRVLECSNFLAIPFKLDRISSNTAKPRKKVAR